MPAKIYRYLFATGMILAMIGTAEWLEEKEIIFPEMAALLIGMWIVDKRVWRVSRSQLVVLMTAGALAGTALVRYSPFPLLVNITLAFLFAALCLTFTRSTLIPLISACILPVLLNTESLIYPLSVCVMSLLVIGGQYLMEKAHLRQPVSYTPVQRSRRKELFRWSLLLISLVIIAFLPVYTARLYCILPPLIVTYTEFASSKAGFRNRPVQIFLLLVIAATLGAGFQLLLHHYLGLSEIWVALSGLLCLFAVYEWTGKYFAPAGAIMLIPMLLPSSGLAWFPLQVALGAAVFIGTAMLLFLKCYKWPRAYLIVCLLPSPLRRTASRRHRKPMSLLNN